MVAGSTGACAAGIGGVHYFYVQLDSRSFYVPVPLKQLRHILGISAFYHDSAAALLTDGQVTAAAQEERFSRRKNEDCFPTKAAEFCLRRGGIDGSRRPFTIATRAVMAAETSSYRHPPQQPLGNAAAEVPRARRRPADSLEMMMIIMVVTMIDLSRALRQAWQTHSRSVIRRAVLG